jgi:tetratricopeptide (TPR) repeat protein
MKNIFILFVLFSCFSFAQEIDQRRRAILQIVDQELAEINRLSTQVQSRNPDLLLRMSELYLEKARHYREYENEIFLNIPADKRAKINKNEYFKQSNYNFIQARKTAQLILKRFPRFSKKAEVYYILAYDAKEHNRNQEALKYFQLANKLSGKNDETKAKSQIALAELYYNKKDYRKAIPLYQASLRVQNDRWWTKDAFNLAWSYYRVKNYSQAISLMQNIYRKSQDSKYIDMSSMVLRDIGLFYADANKMAEGINFYKSVNVDATSQLIKVGNYLSQKGNYTSALTVYNAALNFEPKVETRIIIYMDQLELFDKFSKIDSHYKVSVELLKYYQQKALNLDQIDRLRYHIDRHAAIAQKKAASDLYTKVPKTRNFYGRLAIGYFELSKQLNPDKVHEKIFLQAETHFVMKHYQSAMKKYLEAYDGALLVKDNGVKSKSMEGMLAILALKGFEKKNERFYEDVYVRYLKEDSKSANSAKIYQGLFNVYFDQKNMLKAEQVVSEYSANHPKHRTSQEAMLARIMEHYRVKKDYGQIKRLVAEINQGKYVVSPKYSNRLKILMTNIQMEDVQALLNKGDKAEALRGYITVFNDPDSTSDAKKNSSYNITVLYYELRDWDKTYEWALTTLKLMTPSEVSKFEKSFIAMGASLFDYLRFDQSSDLTMQTMLKQCSIKSSNKDLMFKNAAFIQIAQSNISKIQDYLNVAARCKVSLATMNLVRLELAKLLLNRALFQELERELVIIERDRSLLPHVIYLSEPIRLNFVKFAELAKASQIRQKNINRYLQSVKAKVKLPVKSLDVIASYYLEDLSRVEDSFTQIKVTFPENVFNANLKRKFQVLDQLTNSALKVTQTGSGIGMVDAYQVLIQSYQSLVNEIKNVDLGDKSIEYKQSFAKSMVSVTKPLENKVNELKLEIAKQIKSYAILSDKNLLVVNSDLYEKGFKIHFLPYQSNITMQRLGGNQ